MNFKDYEIVAPDDEGVPKGTVLRQIKMVHLSVRNHKARLSKYRRVRDVERQEVCESRIPLYAERAAKRQDLFKGSIHDAL